MELVQKNDRGFLSKFLLTFTLILFASMCFYGSKVFATNITYNGVDYSLNNEVASKKYVLVVFEDYSNAYAVRDVFTVYASNYPLYLDGYSISTQSNYTFFENHFSPNFTTKKLEKITEYGLSTYNSLSNIASSANSVSNIRFSNFDLCDKDGNVLYESDIKERGTDQGSNSGNVTDSSTGDNGDTTGDNDNSNWFTRILEGISSIGEFFASLINSIASFFGDLFTNLGNWFGELGTNLGNWFSNLGSNIGSWFITVFENLGNIISYINPWHENFLGNRIIEMLSDLLHSLFIPKQESITNFQDVVGSKFGFVDSIKTAISSIHHMIENNGQAPKLYVNIKHNYIKGDVAILDFAWYSPYKNYGDLVLTGFIYALFIWRLFVNLPNTINGVGGTATNISSSVQKFSDGGGKR